MTRTTGPDWRTATLARWQQLPPRERRLLAWAGLLLLAAALWHWSLAPSWQTLRRGPEQAQALDGQLQRMKLLQAQAQGLQKQAPLDYDAALRALTLATEQTLGQGAQLKPLPERANVSVQAVSADALARWLVQARLNARSVPLEVHLKRQTPPNTNTGTWSGVLVMALPAR